MVSTFMPINLTEFLTILAIVVIILIITRWLNKNKAKKKKEY